MAIDKKLITALNQALAGEEEGFNLIYKETYDYVYARCRMIMRNDEDAMELLQETYFAAYRSLDKLTNPDNLFAWLGGIAYNQGMKMFRKKKDELLDENAEGLFDVQENADISTMPGYEMELKETADMIKEIIDELSEPQRAVITAYYYDEMSVTRIAELMDTSPGTIKSRLNYARKYIQKSMEEKEKRLGVRLYASVSAAVFTALSLKISTIHLSEEVAKSGYASICKKAGMTALSGSNLFSSGAGGTITAEQVAAGAAGGGTAAGAAGGGTAAGAAGSGTAAGAIGGGTAAGAAGSGTAAGVAGGGTAAGAAGGGIAVGTAAAGGAGAGITSVIVKVAVVTLLIGGGTAGVVYHHNRTTADESRSVTTESVTEQSDRGQNDGQAKSKEKETSGTDSRTEEDKLTTEEITSETTTTETTTESTTAEEPKTEQTTENVTTETATTQSQQKMEEQPEIESIEQSTQSAPKKEKKAKKEQEVEFDDMEF